MRVQIDVANLFARESLGVTKKTDVLATDDPLRGRASDPRPRRGRRMVRAAQVAAGGGLVVGWLHGAGLFLAR